MVENTGFTEDFYKLINLIKTSEKFLITLHSLGILDKHTLSVLVHHSHYKIMQRARAGLR